MKIPTFVILSMLLLNCLSCSTDDLKTPDSTDEPEEVTTWNFKIADGLVTNNGKQIQLKGVNALNTFGIAKDAKMEEWNVGIVREFIGNLREQPITGPAIQDAQNQFLHALEDIVLEHRKNNRITILCPFGWVDASGNQTLLTGENPAETPFYSEYKVKLKNIATFFAGQEDVWIQTWNEPYHFNNANNYSHELWLTDATDMVENLRSIDGFTNVILVPGNEQGQGEEALLEKGEALLNKYNDVVFDLHAYGKWHDNATVASLTKRMAALQQKQLPIIFGEVGVVTEGAPLSSPVNFLKVCNDQSIGVMAWLWNRNTGDQNTLLTDEGAPNNTNNLNWGTTFKDFLGDL